MSYEVSNGIAEDALPAWLEDAKEKFGCFDDGRINYTHADIAPVVMCTVKCMEEILLLKRSYGLADANGYWSTVNGFIDEVKPVGAQVKQELKEELGLLVDYGLIKIGKSYTLKNPDEKRLYIVFPCLVSLQIKPHIILDREHTDFNWIKRNQLGSYHTLDGLSYTVDASLKL